MLGSTLAMRLVGGSIMLCTATLSLQASGEEARAPILLWDEAREAREQGDLGRAVTLLEQAYESAPDGRTACEVGRLERERHEISEAILWLERCSFHEDLAEPERRAARDEARLLGLATGRLELRGGRPGDRVEVDGEVVGVAPLGDALILRQGPHRLRLLDAGQGRVMGDAALELPGGATTRVDLSALALDRGARQRSTGPFSALWAAVALAGAGIAGGAVAYSLDVEWSRQSGAYSEAQAARLSSAILFGVGGVALAAVLALLPYVIAERRGQDRRAREEAWLSWPFTLGSVRL